MPRPFLATFRVVAVCLLVSAAPRARGDELLDRVKSLLQADDGRSAATLLEDALPSASAEARPEVLRQLRAAYTAAIRQAEADGKTREAEGYRENLAILSRKSAGKVAAPAPDAPSRPKVEPRPEAPIASSDSQSGRPARERVVAPKTRDDAVARAVVVDTPSPSSDAGPADKQPQPPHAPRALAAPGDITEADAAFRAKKYDEAGRIYAALAREGHLPEARKDPWAYCRMYDVVRRINAAPQSAADWASIREEIRQIRELSPKNWYAEYLRNLTLELAPKAPRGQTKRVVLRGSAPEEPTTPSVPSTRRAVEPAKPSDAMDPPVRRPAPVQEKDEKVGQAGQPIGNWKVWDTPSFRILHADEALAVHVARIAERARAEQMRRWAGSSPAAAWTPRCDIYLYPTAAIFRQATGQPESSPGFSTMGLTGGHVTARRVNLRADHTNLLKTILPHEVTHVVLADLFCTQQIPRWADEGMAVLSEPRSEQDLRAADLEGPLKSGELFKLSDLMVMDYPNGRFWSLYYAQSVSLTRFLVEQGTPAQFVQFVKSSQRAGVENELRRVYRIEGFADLQKRWIAHVQAQDATLANAKREGTGSAAETRQE
jgi:hypothetical protein